MPASAGISFKPIEDVCVGDRVYSYNERTGAIGINIVTSTFENSTRHLADVTINGQVQPTMSFSKICE